MPTPLDAVQPGAADVTSPSPVDTTGLNAPTGQPVDDSAVAGLPMNGGQPLSSNPTAQAQPPKPSMWKNVLHGALAGLENSGPIGAIGGAIDPQAAIQAKQNRMSQQASKTQFASLQAASEMMDISFKKHQIAYMGPEFQAKVAQVEAPLAEAWIKSGINPVAVSADGSDKAMAATLRGLGDSYPNGVPPLLQIHMASGQVMLFDPSRMGNNQNTVDQINTMQAALGNPYTTAEQLNNKTATPPATKNNLTTKSAGFWSPAVKSLDEASAKLGEYKGYAARIDQLPDSDPYKQTAQAQASRALDILQNQYDKLNTEAQNKSNRQQKVGEAISMARAKAYGAYRYGPYIDEGGSLVVLPAGIASQRSLAPAQQGVKAMGQAQQLNDIIQGSLNAREAIGQMDKPFSPQAVGVMTMAMRNTDDTVVKQILDSELGSQNLTPQQQNIVVAFENLHERAMALRSVAGIGQQGSDTMRAAIITMLPGLKDADPALMMKKLDAFDQQTTVLARGIPKVKGVPAAGSQFNRAPQAAQPQQKSQPQQSNRPAGAIGKAKGSDGQWHWTDGKSDLGVAQ